MPKIAKSISRLGLDKWLREQAKLAQADPEHSADIAVGGAAGLRLTVRGPAAYWFLRATVAGKRSEIGIGAFTERGLAEARVKANELRRQIKDGRNPVAERQALRDAQRAERAAPKGRTFRQVADAYIEKHGPTWSSSHRRQWEHSLNNHAHRFIGDILIAELTTDHVLNKVLNRKLPNGKTFWEDTPRIADRVRMFIDKVVASARPTKEFTGDSPAAWRGNLAEVLPAPDKIKSVVHYPAVPYEEMPRVWRELGTHTGFACKALQLMILTATRPSEARGALHAEFDLVAKTWTIPSDRQENESGMKSGEPHTIPLSDAAVALVRSLPIVDDNPHLFPSPSVDGACISDSSTGELFGRLCPKYTMHGCRSSFHDWASNETTHSHQTIELSLSHSIGDKTVTAYARSRQLRKRAALMADWAGYLTASCATPCNKQNVEAAAE